MFSKAKRFEPLGAPKPQSKITQKLENEKEKQVTTPMKPSKPTPVSASKTSSISMKKTAVPGKKLPVDTISHCSSSIQSFATPKPLKAPLITKSQGSLKKPTSNTKLKTDTKTQEELIKAQEVEIKNKDHTISEYNRQIEELKNEISILQSKFKYTEQTILDINSLDKKISEISLNDQNVANNESQKENQDKDNEIFIENLKFQIRELEAQCDNLEREASNKQVELTSLEEIIVIRDSLCKDLQDKLTNMENCLEETRQRLEMVKGHHALALDANESIRREYKAEIETLKAKLDEEKQALISKCKADQDNIKAKYNALVESIKDQMLKEKYEIVQELEQQLNNKDQEMKAKLDQIDEATHEKLRICEIQFEERTRNIQDHCEQQQLKIQMLEKEEHELKYSISLAEEQNLMLQKELNCMKNDYKTLASEKSKLEKEVDDLKEEFKQKLIDFENEKNKLIADVDKITKDKNKFEMSLFVTRDIVEVLTMRLRESDNELENLEDQVQVLKKLKEELEKELSTSKNTLNNTVVECNEYKDALVNILKSKAALAKEHTRIMEHNVSLIESLQNVEKEAYRELGSIKNELIEDVELLKKESNSQIQLLRDEVEKKRMLCELATEHAGQAAAAAEQSRTLLSHAANEITRLENENQRYQQEIHDQQSLVVELSLLRQENEELTMTVAKQSSIIDKMKKEMEQQPIKPKSPLLIRKTHKIGKENLQIVSPLRERNQ